MAAIQRVLLLLACIFASIQLTVGRTQRDGCEVVGCSKEVCAESGQHLASICMWKPEYACYKEGVCEKQAGGKCGWTQTIELRKCIESLQDLDEVQL